jgi:cell wall-associated NlpC family hydrolase
MSQGQTPCSRTPTPSSFDGVLAEARRWKETPVRHLGRSETGVDCLGLVMVVGFAAGVLVDPGEPLDPWRKYGRVPKSDHMRAGMDKFFIRLGDEAEHRPGDIGFFSWGSMYAPNHLAIMGLFEGRETMIHAHGGIRPPRVVETTYGAEWPSRCHGFYRYPGLA